ncbi:MAG: DmsC/YnfH family molybdoenzyme membrane anchor subunit [Actinomycetota bacterium]
MSDTVADSSAADVSAGVTTPVDLIARRPRRSDHGVTASGPALLPLQAGQQYRFTFDMSACVGCHSCEVACAEQNALPVGTVWRRVGEIEGGTYPETRSAHLSMACNHCLEPTCLEGCPADAYVKLSSGVVDHLADECIGCQYCTWTCPYSVPVFQPDRRIVSKCDMCAPRLEQGFTSACVDACPTHAIGIEIVEVDEWRIDHAAADGPNLPSADISLSTTRLVLPDDLPADTHTAGDHALAAEHPHWPLVFVTLLTEVAIGLFVASIVAGDAGDGRMIAAWALATTFVGMNASLLHLGRPIMAAKAFRGWRHSWLSREAIAFVVSAAACGVALAAPSTVTAAVGAAVAVVAAFASAKLYMLPARPSWDSAWTVVAFVASGLATGGALHAVLRDGAGALVSAIGVVVAVAAHVANLVRLRSSTELERRGTWTLVVGPLRPWFVLRLVSACVAVAALALGAPVAALVAVVITELTGRWLFYVSVVPYSIPGAFFRGRI